MNIANAAQRAESGRIRREYTRPARCEGHCAPRRDANQQKNRICSGSRTSNRPRGKSNSYTGFEAVVAGGRTGGGGGETETMGKAVSFRVPPFPGVATEELGPALAAVT